METSMQETMLNPTIAAYIEESNAFNIEALAAHFKTDAIVEDEGVTHEGIAKIRQWLEKTQSEYRFALEALDHAKDGNETIVTCLVTGTFPGSPIRLRFFFTVDGQKIGALSIRE
jgi:hypothetical protein